jgi:hypothetical protein
MTWHTITVAETELDHLLATIRRVGGSIMHSLPSRDGYTVIYATLED